MSVGCNYKSAWDGVGTNIPHHEPNQTNQTKPDQIMVDFLVITKLPGEVTDYLSSDKQAIQSLRLTIQRLPEGVMTSLVLVVLVVLVVAHVVVVVM